MKNDSREVAKSKSIALTFTCVRAEKCGKKCNKIGEDGEIIWE